jgi:hypothetical protein
MLPEIARGDANKVWIVPSEIGAALEGLGSVVGRLGAQATGDLGQRPAVGATSPPAMTDGMPAGDVDAAIEAAEQETEAALSEAHAEVREALEAAQQATATPDGR